MKNKSNNNISPKSDDTEYIDLLLNDFKTALKKEYITTIISKMIYFIQNNVTSEIIGELNFIHNHSLIKVSKMHDQFEYLKFLQEHVIPYINFLTKLIHKVINFFLFKSNCKK